MTDEPGKPHPKPHIPYSIRWWIKQSLPSYDLQFKTIDQTDPTKNPRYEWVRRFRKNAPPATISRALHSEMEDFEDALMNKAYFKALGQPDPEPNDPEAGFIDDLVGHYLAFGLVAERKEAEAAIRRLQEMAREAAAEAVKDVVPFTLQLRETVTTLGQGVTLGHIEQLDPTTHPLFEQLPVDVRFDKTHAGWALGLNMLQTENIILEKAFCKARGQPDPFPDCSRAELIEALAVDYAFFGIADGKATTEERVRGYEAVMARQGKDRVFRR